MLKVLLVFFYSLLNGNIKNQCNGWILGASASGQFQSYTLCWQSPNDKVGVKEKSPVVAQASVGGVAPRSFSVVMEHFHILICC